MHANVVLDLLLALALGLISRAATQMEQERDCGNPHVPFDHRFRKPDRRTLRSDWELGDSRRLLSVAAMLVVGNLARLHAGPTDPGLTTETAALIMFAVGAAVSRGLVGPAIVVTGSVAVLLQWKGELHRFVARIEEAELRAASRLALIGLVILSASAKHRDNELPECRPRGALLCPAY